jgi:hypothetical protein
METEEKSSLRGEHVSRRPTSPFDYASRKPRTGKMLISRVFTFLSIAYAVA